MSASQDDLVRDPRRLRAGEMEGLAFLAKYQASRLPVLESIWGNLHDYVADAEIRAKNPEYGSMQNDELARLIAKIEAGASSTELATVTFLGRSSS